MAVRVFFHRTRQTDRQTLRVCTVHVCVCVCVCVCVDSTEDTHPQTEHLPDPPRCPLTTNTTLPPTTHGFVRLRVLMCSRWAPPSRWMDVGQCNWRNPNGQESKARRRQKQRRSPICPHTHTQLCTHMPSHINIDRCDSKLPHGRIRHIYVCVCVCVSVSVACFRSLAAPRVQWGASRGQTQSNA